jgi:hypothetical protein
MSPPPRGRILLAWVVVVVTVIAVWKFVDYRNQPPEVPKQVTSDM